MTKNIKIFIDAHVFDHEFQGSRTYIKELYNELTKCENITFYFAAQDVENLKLEIYQRKNVFFVPYKTSSSTLRLLFELPSLLKRLKIDFAHFQYIVPPIKVCKYIVTTHDVIFHDYPEEFSKKYRFVKHWLYKISAKKADILTTVSDFSKKSINHFFNIPLSRIHVVPNAVGKDFFQQYDKFESRISIKKKFGVEKYIIVVSRIEPRKNHLVVLNAFLNLGLFEQGYSLVFVGKESIVDKKLKLQISNLTDKQSKQFFHIEGISEKELIDLYNAAEMAIYPSKAEGFGIPPLESASLKVLTLCSNKSAMEDFSFFKEQQFDPYNQDQLEEKMIGFINGKNRHTRLDEIFQAINEKYSWKISAKTLEELIITF